MKNLYVCMNLFNYEKVISPPIGLPKNMTTCYITDNEKNKELALKLGWDIVKEIKNFNNISDKLERRICVADIKCFPKKYIDNIDEFKFIFLNDSNIVKIRSDYNNFVNSCTDDKCLFVTSNFYFGERDNIVSEMLSSNQLRWLYNYKKIKESTEKYLTEFEKIGKNYKDISVVSGKYLGWNIRHEKYDEISKKIYEERKIHLQGNIILTYISEIYSDYVNKFPVNNKITSILNQHNFQS